MNFVAPSFGDDELGGLTRDWRIKISPDSWALSIWGPIYILLFGFVIYQALPAKCVKSRNEKVIFEEFSYVFAVNLVLNGVWLIIFQ